MAKDATDPFLGWGTQPGDQSFSTQARDFVTSPPVMMAVGGAAGAGAFGGAEAAGAAGGGEAASGGSEALGSGITPGAAGVSGITPGVAGASGISASGAAGTSLAPGFFASEGASVLPGSTGAAGATGSDVLPPTTPAAPGATPSAGATAPAGGAPGGTGITPPPSTGAPSVSGLQVGSGGAPTGAGGVEAPGVVPNPAAATPTPTPSYVDKAMASIKANPLPAASLGLNIWSQLNANKAGKSAQDQLNRNAQPVSDASKQLLQEGLAGKVPTAIMQQYQQSFNDRVSEIKQRYASMGRDPNTDSAAQADIAKAKQDMDGQVAQYAASLVNQGLQAAGVASGPQTQAVIAGMQQDKDLQAALSGSLNSLALFQALQRNQQTPAPAAATP